MIGYEQARQLAEDWVAAWSRRDLDVIMAHYAEGIELQSRWLCSASDCPKDEFEAKTISAPTSRGD